MRRSFIARWLLWVRAAPTISGGSGCGYLARVKLTTLNPFRGLDEPVRVWAWGMFDLANQSFTLLINTLLFALFFKRVVVTDPDRGDFLWSLTVAISLFVVVLLGPVLGVLAD